MHDARTIDSKFGGRTVKQARISLTAPYLALHWGNMQDRSARTPNVENYFQSQVYISLVSAQLQVTSHYDWLIGSVIGSLPSPSCLPCLPFLTRAQTSKTISHDLRLYLPTNPRSQSLYFSRLMLLLYLHPRAIKRRWIDVCFHYRKVPRFWIARTFDSRNF